jgi:hypothetical protein
MLFSNTETVFRMALAMLLKVKLSAASGEPMMASTHALVAPS